MVMLNTITTTWPLRQPPVWAIALGVSFGLLLRVFASLHMLRDETGMGLPLNGVVTILYLVLGSAAVGYIAVWGAEIKARRPVWQWIVMP